MPKATKRVVRTRKGRKSEALQLRLTDAAVAILEKERRHAVEFWKRLHAPIPNKEPAVVAHVRQQGHVALNELHRRDLQAALDKFLAEPGNFTEPKPLRSLDDVVTMAAIGHCHLEAARALCAAILQAAGADLDALLRRQPGRKAKAA